MVTLKFDSCQIRLLDEGVGLDGLDRVLVQKNELQAGVNVIKLFFFGTDEEAPAWSSLAGDEVISMSQFKNRSREPLLKGKVTYG